MLKKIYTQFPGGKHKVLTLSYDDGKVPDRKLVSILNEHGIKYTFNVNSGLEKLSFKESYEERIPMSEYARLYAGHEIATHTVTHPTIARSPKEQMVLQFIEDRRALEELLKVPVRGNAYPNGSFSDEVVEAARASGIAYARTIKATKGYDLPTDYLRWNPTCHHSDPDFEKIYTDFLDLHKTQYLYLLYVWGHSYEFERDGNWEIIEKFAKKVGGKDDIWYATNIEIVDYLEAANRVQVAVDGSFAYNPNACSIFFQVENDTVELLPGRITEL